MKVNTRIALTVATIALATSGYAENVADMVQGIMSQTNHTLIPLLDWRARYEYGNQDGLDAAHAATLRARVGLQSQDYSGFSGLVEFEATRAIDPDSYSVPGKTGIADPESTELNRAQLQFNRNDNLLIGGRQRIILDNARFIGNVGWRQNEQTYDAFSYKNTMIENVALYYAYLEKVNRIFGSESTGAAHHFNSDSHLLNASYTGLKNQTLTGYAYLLEFDNAAANSSDTFGLSYAVKGTVAEDYTVNGYAEYAYQQAGNNFAYGPITDYSANYFHLNGKVARDGYSALLGYELLGSDAGNIGFRTPLATGHKFNGWNDQFLVTPDNGLQDFYLGVGLPVPKAPLTFVYHIFSSDEGSIDYGQEFDAVAVHKISPKMKAIAKASYFAAAGDVPAYSSDRTRFSIEVNYKY